MITTHPPTERPAPPDSVVANAVSVNAAKANTGKSATQTDAPHTESDNPESGNSAQNVHYFAPARAILTRMQTRLAALQDGRASDDILQKLRADFAELHNCAAAAGLDAAALLTGNVDKLLAQHTRESGDNPGLLHLLEEIYDGLRADLTAGDDAVNARATGKHINSLNSLLGLLVRDDAGQSNQSNNAITARESVESPPAPLANESAMEDSPADKLDESPATSQTTITHYAPQLRAIVAEAAAQHNKDLTFSIAGGELKIDRRVLDGLRIPLECLAHDAAEKRVASGAHIRLTMRRRGRELLLDYTEDGDGFDLDAVAARAVAIGLTADRAAVGAMHLAQILTQPGEPLALAYPALRELGGLMALANANGKPGGRGIRAQFRLPLDPRARALLVAIGGNQFALMTNTIERAAQLRADQLPNDNAEQVVTLNGEIIPLINIAAELGAPRQPDKSRAPFAQLVVMRAVDRLAAVQVDRLDGLVDIAAVNTGGQTESLRALRGVATLADARSAAILDPVALLARDKLHSAALVGFVDIAKPPKPPARDGG